ADRAAGGDAVSARREAEAEGDPAAGAQEERSRARAETIVHAGAGRDRDPGAASRQSQCRPRLWRLSARPVQDRVRARHRPRQNRRSQGDDHAGRALRQCHGHPARLCQGAGMVQARLRCRRPRSHVRTRHAAHVRPRRPGRQERGGQADGLRRQARRTQGGLQSRLALSRRPDPAAG
ncbi:hypothetical protein KXW36_000272, partial [Aspergillus fumigatus]